MFMYHTTKDNLPHPSRLHEQMNESEQAAQCYIKYIQDIYSCGVSEILNFRNERDKDICPRGEIMGEPNLYNYYFVGVI